MTPPRGRTGTLRRRQRLSRPPGPSRAPSPSRAAPACRSDPERFGYRPEHRGREGTPVGGASRRGQTLGPSLDGLLQRAATHHQRGDLAAAESALPARRSRPTPRSREPCRSSARSSPSAATSTRRSSCSSPRPSDSDRRPTDTFGFHNNYANTLRLAGRNAEAETVLRQLVAIAPREWQPWHNLGQVLKDLQRFDEAVGALRRAVALAPEYGPNHGVLGEVLNKLGRLRSARRIAADVHRARLGHRRQPLDDPRQQPPHARRADRSDRVPRARASSSPTDRRTRTATSASCFAQAGRFDEALMHFRTAIEAEPENDLLHSNGAYGLLTAGELVEGWREWEWGAVHGGPRGEERRLEVPRWTPGVSRRSRHLLPRAGRRRRAAVRVVLPRPHRGGATTW